MSTVHRRLAELRSQFAIGERSVHELMARRTELDTAMLRISGAIQVLEELVAELVAGTPAEPPVAHGDVTGAEPWTLRA